MDEQKRQFVQAWLDKAHHDLAVASKLFVDPDAYFDVAVYHCQQAAEKAVKAFLAFHDQPIVKTHDLEPLINVAASCNSAFSTWLTVGQRLTPFATEFRYPGVDPMPDKIETEQAIQDATDLYSFVLSLIPADAHPPTS